LPCIFLDEEGILFGLFSFSCYFFFLILPPIHINQTVDHPKWTTTRFKTSSEFLDKKE